MRWQKVARLVIAGFVIVFAGVVFFSMRQRAALPAAAPEAVNATDPNAYIETGKGVNEQFKEGKVVTALKFARQLTYSDGKGKWIDVEIEFKDKDGRPMHLSGKEAEMVAPPGQTQSPSVGKISGDVKLKSDTGLEITANEATFQDQTGMLTIPGPVQFTKGRMSGKGVGATYNRNNDVLWILAEAQVTVTPDAAGGGAIEATSGSAGLARADNYMKLENAARIVSDGRTAEAAIITLFLDESGEKVQRMELREQSRITGTGAGAQTMVAKDIDLAYGPDGRTLQSSKLMQNAMVELPGADGGAPRRISGTTIDILMSPDGATVTSLNAMERVQVDLPAEGDAPGKHIRSSSLHATGQPGQGLQHATFEGGVDYTETRTASGKTPAGERKARSLRLIVATKPGLGPIEQADFRGNVRFTDADTAAEAPRALYTIAKDMLDLSPSDGDTGTGPAVTNPQLRVEARNIHLSPSSKKLTADTDVRSSIKAQKRGAAEKGKPDAQGKMPVMLKQDQPVTVTSNRLVYDGVAEATYSGNALLWQGSGSRISGDTIVLNDRTGNLVARGGVRTTMMLMDENPKTKEKKPTVTNASSDLLDYNDAKRLATYTATGETLARLASPQGDMSGKRIDLFLSENGNEIERAESDDTVSVKLEKLYATGKHLVYTATSDTYLLTGEPAVSIQKDDQGACKRTDGTTMTYHRATGFLRSEGIAGMAATRSKPLDTCPAELKH